MVRFRPGGPSGPVEDRRGQGGGFGGLPIGIGKAGGLTGLIGLLVALFLGGRSVFTGGGSGINIPGLPGVNSPVTRDPNLADPQAGQVTFVKQALGDIEATWQSIFASSGTQWEPTTLVLYTDVTDTGCGTGEAATGPFYCPVDRKVYLDLGFFNELTTRFSAPGDLAEAYVIAHEVGHHVQNLLGISAKVSEHEQADPASANAWSVKLELQADCFAGVWAHSAYAAGELQAGDLQEALAAAAAVGDDRLQQQAGRAVNPDNFTHGSSEQRVSWFSKGYDQGDPNACDTFA
jgi:predicted metalloprotease